MRQFWHTVTYSLEAKIYFFTLDDQSFEVNADLLRDALHITSKDSDHPFVTPPPHDEIKASGYDIPRLALLQVLWKMVTNTNVDYADLIWEDFKFQIDSRQISTKKKELLPFPRFTKLIIKHILPHHNIVSKRLQSDKHGIKLDAVLKNLKFANKGAKDPIYGMEIPKEMLSDEIKASADYLNYLAKSMGTQPAKGQVIEETGKSEEVANTVDSEETDEDEVHPNERQTSIIIGRGFHKKSQEGTLDHSKKLKGIETLSSAAQYLQVKKSLKMKEPKLMTPEKAEDVKDANEQAEIDQPGKVQVEVSVPDPQVEKLVTQLLNTSLTLSSAEYGNQFINDNLDVSLTDMRKDRNISLMNRHSNKRRHNDEDPSTNVDKEAKKRRRMDTRES
ncbi:hypothetical protein Tco_0554314 [Tanacetum coccineum]